MRGRAIQGMVGAMRAAWSLVVVATACGPAALGTAASPKVAPSASPAASSAPAVAAQGEAAAGPVAASSASVPASSSAPPPTPAAAPASADPRLTIEPPYHAGAYPWPPEGPERKERIAELARWNDGSLGEDRKWHAQPRVVIGEPVVARGKADTRAVMRALRAEQYWTVRKCFDPRVAAEPALEGRTLLSLKVSASGVVTAATLLKKGDKRIPDTRKFPRAMPDAAVTSCLAQGFSGISVPAAPGKGGKGATLLVSIDVWPGDAPIPERDASPKPGRVPLAAVADALEKARPALSACIDAATTREPGLWGRVALRVDVSEQGAAGEIAETESTFPDRKATACLADVLRAVPWPEPKKGAARVVVAFRVDVRAGRR